MNIKKLAEIKLNEFHRWRSIAGIKYELINVSGDWQIDLFEFDRNHYNNVLLDWWQREAPYEANEIIKGVNGVENTKQRSILVMTYILPEKTQNTEQMEMLNIKSSVYYLSKSKALESFAKSYKGGKLEALSD